MSDTSEEREYAIIDVETSLIADGEIPKTKFWGYADSQGYKYFKTTKQLCKFLEHTPPKTILHHSNFDVIQLLVDDVTLSILKSHNGRLIKCKLQDHFLLNSYSAFPVALKGKTLPDGTKTQGIFEAFGYVGTSLDELDKRNYDDCVTGLKCFLELDQIFQSLVFVSPLRRGTIASTGFGAAEKFAGKMPKDLRFLPAYRGGRVEVFDTRQSRCANYDINSSYPRSFLEAQETETLMHVRVKTKDWHCPLFDTSNDEMLLFPNGAFESYVYESTWQRYIEPFADRTSIKVLKRTKIDFSWICKLKELVETIYAKKSISKGAIKLCCKLLLNSLYGRIGLKGESERARILDYYPDGDDVTVYILGKERWLVFDKVERESRSNFPFAAFITDNARGRLFKAFKRNHPSYGDTDSIFTPVSKSQFSESIGEDLGQWSYNGKAMFQARNVKDYLYGKKEVRKGGTDKTIWTMKRFAAGDPAKRVIRERKTGLRKRQVLPNGETLPHTVNN